MKSRRLARECALQSLYYADSLKSPDKEMLSRYTAAFQKELGDTFSFCEDLVCGTTKHLPEIDKIVSAYAKNWTVARMSAVDRSILRMATYEMIFSQDHAPVPAIIDEAIELAKKYSTENSSKFINGLLDQLKKERK